MFSFRWLFLFLLENKAKNIEPTVNISFVVICIRIVRLLSFVWLLCLYFISLDCLIMCMGHLVIRKPQLSQTLILRKFVGLVFRCFTLLFSHSLSFSFYFSLSLILFLPCSASQPNTYVNYSYKFKLTAWSTAKFILVEVEYLKLMCSWQTYQCVTDWNCLVK